VDVLLFAAVSGALMYLAEAHAMNAGGERTSTQ
jgi:hypothetical protein